MIAAAKTTPEHTRPRFNASRVASVVLLSGAVRPTPFRAAIGRSVLNLPCGQERTILQAWQEQVAALTEMSPRVAPLIRVLAGPETLPAVSNASGVSVEISHDRSALRGTGGVLRDIAEANDPEHFLIVANAAQILLWPLVRLFNALSDLDADIGMIAHEDGAPATLMMIRCACLKELPEFGFIDFKEQSLPEITRRHVVRVAAMPFHVCWGIRTAQDYLSALRSRELASHGERPDPLAENWRSEVQIMEDGADVASEVKLHNSVVLRGAQVGKGAVLVRSVICQGAIVRPGAVVVDSLVSAVDVAGTSAGAS